MSKMRNITGYAFRLVFRGLRKEAKRRDYGEIVAVYKKLGISSEPFVCNRLRQ